MKPAAVIAGGVLVAAAAASAVGVPANDTRDLITYSLARPSRSTPPGWVALRRSRSPVVVALIPVASITLGALAAARAMFVSSHDLSAPVVVVAGAGTAGLLGALALASELERARRRVEAMAERERALERSRRELVAWVSHDLRTPIAGIRAMVEALDDGLLDEPGEIKGYHLQLITEADRLARPGRRPVRAVTDRGRRAPAHRRSGAARRAGLGRGGDRRGGGAGQGHSQQRPHPQPAAHRGGLGA